MRCPSCDKEDPGEGLFCAGCGAFIDRHRVAPHDPAAQDDVVAGPPDLGPDGAEDVVGAVRCVDPACTFEVPPGLGSCLMGHPVASAASGLGSAVLALPGGSRVPLVPGVPMELGRHSPDATVAAALAPFDTVSRQHAVVALEGEALKVRHVGRTNPTFANGMPVASELMVPLPAEVGLGRTIRITVTRGNG